jgi:hypothetical protein
VSGQGVNTKTAPMGLIMPEGPQIDEILLWEIQLTSRKLSINIHIINFLSIFLLFNSGKGG